MTAEELEALPDSEAVELDGRYYIRAPRRPGARREFIRDEDDPEGLCSFFEVCCPPLGLRPVKAADIVGAKVWRPPTMWGE